MKFDQLVDMVSYEHRHDPDVKEIIDFVKYRWKHPFDTKEETMFCLAASDPKYSRAGIKVLYKKLAIERREKMITFFSLSEEDLLKLVSQLKDECS